MSLFIRRLPAALAIALALAGSNPARAAKPPESGLNDAGLLNPVGAAAGAAFSHVRLRDGVQVRVNGVIKNVLFYGPDIVRVTTVLDGPAPVHTTRAGLVVVAPPGAADFVVKETPGSIRLAGESLSVEIARDTGAVAYFRHDGTPITRERPDLPQELRAVTISGAPTYEARQSFMLSPDESLYGLGQYDRRFMDYRGKEVLMVQTNIGIVIPLLVSTRRYGILWDAYSKTVFKDDAQGASFWSESAPAGADYYFIAGRDMDGVIANYRRLTGPAPMPPKAALGLFMSKERYKTQQELVDVVKRFRRDEFPIDYIVQDWQYWGGGVWGGEWDGKWSGMVWNKERFPDPAAAIREIHEDLHAKVMISIWPSVGDDTDLARELDAKGLRHEPIHWISKKARIYDAFSAEGRSIYFKHIKKGLLDLGIDALWMDGTEVEVGSACHDPRKVEADIKSLGSNALGDYTRYLNAYSLVTTQGTYEGQRATSDKRVLTLTRSAWAGQQRYSALSWSGDTTASWATFRDQIAGGINVAMAGQPYWTQDTGGFFIPGNFREGSKGTPAYRELFARWHQFAIFNPIYRIHGTDIEREPYLFRDTDPEFYASMRAAAHLRYRMLPYLYALAAGSTRDGYTMMRGLPMDFPDDPKARRLEDQFMFGPALLVHPVTRAMHRTGTPPPPAIPAEALQTPEGRPGVAVEYFEGRNFEKSVGLRTDPRVDYRWPGPPLAEPPAGLRSLDNFSGRWTGYIVAPEDGEHEIGVEGDDGFRLWLDGRLVVDDWRDAALRYKGAKITLRKGQRVAFKIDYYQGGHERGLRLGWRTPGQLAAPARETDALVETYLPAGADWFDFWTNTRHAGDRSVAQTSPLDRLPLFVRAGSILPLGPVVQHVNEQPDAPLELRIYPGADATFTLYEDDNETYAYENGAFATTELKWNDATGTLKIGKRQGDFPGLVPRREFRIVLARPGHGAGIDPVSVSDAVFIYEGKPLSILLGR